MICVFSSLLENQIEEKGVDLGTDDSTEEEMEEEEFDSEGRLIILMTELVANYEINFEKICCFI